MLPKNAWKPHEPRFGFPIFKNARTLISFAIQPTFRPMTPLGALRAARGSLKQGLFGLRDYLAEYGSLLLMPRRATYLRFRLLITSRDGRFLGRHNIPGAYPPGGSIDIDTGDVLAKLNLSPDDYMGVLVMSRGRPDGFRSSPGSYSMTYVGDTFYTTYRTGGFARVLNDPRRKRHVGFRGINPKAVADEQFLGSILLINHSSDPEYDTTVNPKSMLLRADGQTREADFGSIAPFGGRDRTLEDLFGDDVVDFLAPFQGKGTVITTCPGVTLASIHIMRARDGHSMSIEHSRPSHTYLLHGI